MLGFFRFLGSVLLLIGVVALVYDGTRSHAADRIIMTSLMEHWAKLAPAMLAAAQAAVKRSMHPLVWEMGVGRLLQLPAWLVFAVLGLILSYAGRRRRRVNVFAN